MATLFATPNVCQAKADQKMALTAVKRMLPFTICVLMTMGRLANASGELPALPVRNDHVVIPTQPWPHHPGSRMVKILLHYPDGKLERVNEKTGIMLTLHNWGGEDCAGTANPNTLAKRLNVVAICVNYLQSGRKASIEDPEPYDCGYLQSLDALRALWFVMDSLNSAGRPFDDARIFCTGGSGGGNVTLMANKLAPRTFACIIDMCGMKKLSHDIAFNLPGGAGLNARWSRDPASPNYLSVDHQEIRFVGHPDHLVTMKRLGTSSKVIVVHGTGDNTCPFADAREMVDNMKSAKLDVEPHFLTKDDLDGSVFTSIGHGLGNRTEIVFRVAEEYLSTDSSQAIRRNGPSDFERREDIRFKTANGEFIISYKEGFPVGRFESKPPPVSYDEHHDLTYHYDRAGERHEVKNRADWQVRRGHILDNMQSVMGRLPSVMSRVPLDVKVIEEKQIGSLTRRKVSYQSDPHDRVTAWLLIPEQELNKKLPAMLCLHQTVRPGKDEPVGLSGKQNMHYALELAQRGYVTLAPDYPTMGESRFDFAVNPEYVSGTMKAIWDNVRAVDLLQSLPEVDATRIGVIGHSLGGHNAMFTAAFEPRLKVIVSSCGFTTFQKDDVPSWTGPRYMPRIATVFKNDANRVPFDFNEIVTTFAPRPFLACAATGDRDFDVTGVQDVIKSARPIYELLGQDAHLQAIYPESPHDFSPTARQAAFEFLDQHLRADK